MQDMQALGQKKAPVQLEDFLGFSFLSDLKLAPNGDAAAFLQHVCNAGRDGYDTTLWVHNFATGTQRQVLPTGKKPQFCWGGDGRLLCGTPGATTPFVWVNPQDGREEKAFAVPLRVKKIEAVGGGRWLVNADTRLPAPVGFGSDEVCTVLEELPFQANGQGYTAGLRNSLLIYDEADGSLSQITPALFEVVQYSYCAAQGKVVCCGQEYEDVCIVRGGIYLYDLEKREGATVLKKGDYRMMFASMLGDKVLFAGALGRRGNIMENSTFLLLNAATGEIAPWCRANHYIHGLGVGSDCRYGGGTVCKVQDGRVYFSSAHGDSTVLFEIDPAGQLHALTHLPGSVDCFDVQAGRIAFVGMRGMGLQEVYTLAADGQESCHTAFNKQYVDSHVIQTPQPCHIQNRDGDAIEGWVIPPVGFDERESYPGILNIHGGPKGTYGMVYYHEMQVWAAAGYFVFFCNPRGSDGYGDEFSHILGRNGTLDYDDIMEFCDHVLEVWPQIDENRLGVTGGSYGGFMTNWIVGHTHRFAAAATQRSIGDWLVHYADCDTGYWVTSEMFPPSPLYAPAHSWNHSPGKYAAAITTPLLFIHSDGDLRCPLSEAMAVYAGAAGAGAEVRMCLFHGENHELSRAGRPANRVKRLSEIGDWMDKHLKGGAQG
ncbi:S9 family peptidase [Ruminococcaceae bacterium OttesenSCG-928-O06]|nr:S9 family peptidase [Ruminococcaceae bacterium OttesenSCG-928-O06]